MVKVKEMLVSQSVARRVTYTGTNTKRYIIIHETANTSKGADAEAHGRLQRNGNSRDASWNYTVDDKVIVKSFSDNTQTWGAGNKYYNQNGINIEIAVNQDGNYKKAVDNAVWLTKMLMDKYNIPLKNVITHKQTSGWKNCPAYLLNGTKGITWNDFKNKVNGKKVEGNSKPKPNLTIKQVAQEVLRGDWGNGETRTKRLRDAGYDPSAVRKEVNRIANGTTSKPRKTNKEIAKEVVSGKWGNGEDRKKRLRNAGYNPTTIQNEVNKIVNKTNTKPKKTIKQVAQEIYRGQGGWGNGETRKKRLRDAGYNPTTVQNEVNRLSGVGSKPKYKKVTNKIVSETIRGNYGNGKAREDKLRSMGYDPKAVQREINKRY